MELKAKDKLIVAFLVVLAIVVFIGGRMYDTKTGFETEKWVAYEGNSRQLMVKDLVNRTRFAGMTREEVKILLGEAEEEQEAFLIYYVGMPQGLFGTKPDSNEEYLVLEFAEASDTVSVSAVMTADTLPKESMFRIKGEATENTVLTPQGKKE